MRVTLSNSVLFRQTDNPQFEAFSIAYNRVYIMEVSHEQALLRLVFAPACSPL